VKYDWGRFFCLVPSALVMLLFVSSCVANERSAGGGPAEAEMFLVFKVGCKSDAASTSESITATFLYRTSKDSVSPEDVLRNGLYFGRLARALAYVRSLPDDERAPLEYRSLQYLEVELSMFEEFPADVIVEAADDDVSAPDIALSAADVPHWAMFATPLRIGDGGVVYAGPSGVPISEGWALTFGTYVPDLQAVLDGSELALFRVNGRTLE